MRARKVHMFKGTVAHGLHWSGNRRMLFATDPRDVTCLICRYHLGLHKPTRQLPFSRERTNWKL